VDPDGRGYGTVFKMTATGVLTTLVNFTDNGTKNKGAMPETALVQGSDGNFYGTTLAGGTNGYGTVFKMTPAGALTTLVNFAYDQGGFWPEAGLVQGIDGNFYGTTYGGGTNYRGTSFKMTPAGVLTTLVNFNELNGTFPEAGLCKGDDGNLYGTTSDGGASDFGTVYRIRFGPTPVTNAATAIASTTATLNGTVNPNGLFTTATFQIGTAANLAGARTLFETTLPAGTTVRPVSRNPGGLNPNTKYYFRVVAQNAENAIPQTGKILFFTTLP